MRKERARALARMYRKAAESLQDWHPSQQGPVGCCDALDRVALRLRWADELDDLFAALFKPSPSGVFWWRNPTRSNEDQLARRLALDLMACYIETDYGEL